MKIKFLNFVNKVADGFFAGDFLSEFLVLGTLAVVAGIITAIICAFSPALLPWFSLIAVGVEIALILLPFITVLVIHKIIK